MLNCTIIASSTSQLGMSLSKELLRNIKLKI